MKKLIILSIFFLPGTGKKANAQDPRFSQYFASPLTLNPAMTGYFEGDHRFNANFRNQWWLAGEPFITNTISYDTKLMRSTINAEDTWAVGILALYDQSLGGGFKNINASASMAYHKGLDADGINSINAGFQVTYATRVLDFSKLDFATQFNGSGFDTNIPANETFGNSRISYFDINTGITYSYNTDNTQFYIGGSLYHITQPNISFLQDGNFNLPMRYTVHMGSRFALGENGNELFVSGLYMQQKGADEKTAGIAYGHAVSEDASVYGGLWYRVKDAVIPYVGITYKDLVFGFTYDAVNSDLQRANPKNGSFELSLGYSIKNPDNHYNNYKNRRIF